MRRYEDLLFWIVVFTFDFSDYLTNTKKAIK